LGTGGDAVFGGVCSSPVPTDEFAVCGSPFTVADSRLISPLGRIGPICELLTRIETADTSCQPTAKPPTVNREPMKAIHVGCGAMSREWLRSAAELGIQVRALVDIEEKTARLRAEEFNLDVPIYTDLKTAIQEAPADAVFDCTIPAAHKQVSSTALAAGLHVLEEKPLALNFQDAADLVALADTTGKLHVVLQNRRFNHRIRQLRQMLSHGVIGELTTLHVDFFVAPHFGGFREVMPHVLLADMAIHAFDAARFVAGLNAEAVFCEEWIPKNSWYASGPSVVAIFRMSSGVRFSYRGSWCADGFRTPWDAAWRVIGTEGT